MEWKKERFQWCIDVQETMLNTDTMAPILILSLYHRISRFFRIFRFQVRVHVMQSFVSFSRYKVY